MKRKTDKITGLTMQQAQVIADSNFYHKYSTTSWEHGYNDRLAQKLYKQGETKEVIEAYFIILLRKRKIANDIVKQIAAYYMARAQVRINKQTEKEN